MIALYVDGRVDLDASVSDVEAAVRSLDGATHSLVVVELPSGKTLTVGGGPDRFVAEAADGTGKQWCVVDPRAPDATVDVIIGAERVPTAARLCVDRATALDAALTFALEGGARSSRLAWTAD